MLITVTGKEPALGYSDVIPTLVSRYAFKPGDTSEDYNNWPEINVLCTVSPINGLMEKRGGALIDIDREALTSRMELYFDPALSFSELKDAGHGLTQLAARYDPNAAREKILTLEKYSETSIRRYLIRPFDLRWCYYTPIRPVWNECRPELKAQSWQGNGFLVSRPSGVASPEGAPIFGLAC